MGQVTGISWTDHTFNPWWGCQRVSPGCEHCYAEHLAVVRRKLPVWGPSKSTARSRTKGPWRDIVKWNRDAAHAGVRRRVFCASMADIFEDHPQVSLWRAEALALLEACTSLDVQLLTKRPENIRRMVPPSWLAPGGWPAHVWVGTTVEDQKRAEQRIPELFSVPAPMRFLSCEPLLESLDDVLPRFLQRVCKGCGCYEGKGHVMTMRPGIAQPVECKRPGYERKISWVIVGGESGPGARPFDIAWARSIVAQCREADVPVFVKQMGDNATLDGKRMRFAARHGADPSEWPEDLRVQEFPR